MAFQSVPRSLIGQLFNRWTVVGPCVIKMQGSRLRKFWPCRCACGTIRECREDGLLGNILSCGCLTRERTIAKHRTHGLSKGIHKVPEYGIWSAVKERCGNPKHKGYSDYGGRGIKMCHRWSDSFEWFLVDMGPRPDGHYSIERLDCNGDYDPSNCIWATRKQQQRNMRSNHILEMDGHRYPVSEWAEKLGFKYPTLMKRIGLGWPIEKILKQPVKVVLEKERSHQQ